MFKNIPLPQSIIDHIKDHLNQERTRDKIHFYDSTRRQTSTIFQSLTQNVINKKEIKEREEIIILISSSGAGYSHYGFAVEDPKNNPLLLEIVRATTAENRVHDYRDARFDILCQDIIVKEDDIFQDFFNKDGDTNLTLSKIAWDIKTNTPTLWVWKKENNENNKIGPYQPNINSLAKFPEEIYKYLNGNIFSSYKDLRSLSNMSKFDQIIFDLKAGKSISCDYALDKNNIPIARINERVMEPMTAHETIEIIGEIQNYIDIRNLFSQDDDECQFIIPRTPENSDITMAFIRKDNFETDTGKKNYFWIGKETEIAIKWKDDGEDLRVHQKIINPHGESPSNDFLKRYERTTNENNLIDSELIPLDKNIEEKIAKSYNIKEVVVRVDAGGDSGDITIESIHDNNDQDIEIRKIPSIIIDIIIDHVERWLPRGYEINNGTYGTLHYFPCHPELNENRTSEGIEGDEEDDFSELNEDIMPEDDGEDPFKII